MPTKGQKSLVKVIDAAPAQIPAPDAVKRALDVLKSAKKPLIILGKGAAYAQADDAIRQFVEKSGAPFLPMSMGKGLLPDTHPQCAGAARSTVLKDSDVVMLIGARLNWLLVARQGQGLGRRAEEIHPGRHRAQGDGFQRRDRRPGGRRYRLLRLGAARRHGQQLAGAAGGLDQRRRQEARRERRQDGAAADEQQLADGLPRRARRACAAIVKERPDAILVNEGANTLDLARGIIDMYQPRKRLDVGTWGIMGIGMGYAIAAAIETGKPVLAVEGDSAFGFSGMEVETICRYKLPICIVDLQQRRHLSRHRRQHRRALIRRRPCSSRAPATTR